MRVEAIAPGSVTTQPRSEPARNIDEARKVAEKLPAQEVHHKNISSEELLDKIKDLAQDGLYSVQFEMHDDVNSLVIRVVDRDSGDLIRQIPSEELIQSAKALRDLRGLMVDTES